MHFIISWEIPSSTSKATFENQLISCFSNFKYIKPLTTIYIVNVSSKDEYNAIFSSLQNIAKTIPNIQLLVSPIMSGGFYNGWLSNELWLKINELSS